MSEASIPISEPGNGIVAMQEKRFKIPGDVVNKATAELPDNQRSAIRWLHAYGAENDLSNAELGALIKVSDSTISLIMRGRYEAKLDNIVEEIERFKTLQEKRGNAKKLPFIKTKLTGQIWDVCEAAVEFQRIAFIFGDQQIGKSAALEAYKEAHNHGSTIYIAVPTGGALSHFLVRLAEILRISSEQRTRDLRRRIIEAFDDRMLLIVDEAHQCIAETGKASHQMHTIEFIREIFNERRCGVVICATNVFRDAMNKPGGAAEKVLRQTKRRRLCALQLPNMPTREDLNTFAAAYGLSSSSGAARDLEMRMVEEEALGMWLTLLRMGAKLAARDKTKMQWPHVLSAWAGLKQLEGAK